MESMNPNVVYILKWASFLTMNCALCTSTYCADAESSEKSFMNTRSISLMTFPLVFDERVASCDEKKNMAVMHTMVRMMNNILVFVSFIDIDFIHLQLLLS